MALTADEQKAIEHLAQEKRREAFNRSLQGKLKADPGPAKQTKKNWAPLTTTGYIKGQD